MAEIKSKLKILVPILAVILITIGVLYARSREKKDNFFSGVVEATIYDMAFEIPGTIEQLPFQEGQTVKKGDLLAILDRDAIMADLKRAEAQLGASKANLADLLAGARPQEISQAQAKLDEAKSNLLKMQNGPTQEELIQAQSIMLAARDNFLMLKKGYRKEDIENARHTMESARSSYQTAQKDYTRYETLLKDEAIAVQAYDNKKNIYEVARSNYESASETYRKMKAGFREEEKESAYQQYQAAQAQYENLARGTRYELIKQGNAQVRYWENQVSLLKAGPRADQVKAARKKVQEAEAAVDAAKVKLKYSKIYAPDNGVIVSRNFEEKEMVTAGVPVITMADLEHPWVYIFVPEPDIGKVKIGQKAKIFVDSYPKKAFPGRISRVYEKAEYTPKFIQTQRERVNLVFRVKVAVDNPERILKPGMPADVELIRDGK